MASSCQHPMMGFFPELETIGTNIINCQTHGILQAKTSRSTIVLHDGMICIGGGTTGRVKAYIFTSNKS